MNPTLHELLTELFRAHQEIDSLRARLNELEREKNEAAAGADKGV